MATTAKFVCGYKDEKNKTVHLSPVYAGSDENRKFFAATPGGVISLNLLNEEAFEQFEQGAEFYVVFIPAKDHDRIAAECVMPPVFDYAPIER